MGVVVVVFVVFVHRLIDIEKVSDGMTDFEKKSWMMKTVFERKKKRVASQQ